MPAKIIADHKIPFLKGAFESCAEVMYLPGRDISHDIIVNANALIIRTRTQCNKDLLDGTNVRCIASATIGYDHIDTEYCKQNNIYWTNAPGCNANSVKQYIASALAHILKCENKPMSALCLGVIGAGHVGSRIVNMCKALGIKTLVNDPPRQIREGSQGFTDLETLISESDIITMHVPLLKEGALKTFHMADEAFFAKVKNGSWFINSSRGEVAETNALIAALKSRQIRGAVIDVWENEPFISEELLQIADIATPHIAGYSADGKANGTTMSVRAVSRYFGLGLDHWEPATIPAPEHRILTIEDAHCGREAFFQKLATHTYDIEADSRALKQSLTSFEKLREEYGIRREAEAYTLLIPGQHEYYPQIASALGFNIECIKN